MCFAVQLSRFQAHSSPPSLEGTAFSSSYSCETPSYVTCAAVAAVVRPGKHERCALFARKQVSSRPWGERGVWGGAELLGQRARSSDRVVCSTVGRHSSSVGFDQHFQVAPLGLDFAGPACCVRFYLLSFHDLRLGLGSWLLLP